MRYLSKYKELWPYLPEPVTNAQLNKLGVLFKNIGEDECRTLLHLTYKVDSRKDLSIGQASRFIDYLETEFEPEPMPKFPMFEARVF